MPFHCGVGSQVPQWSHVQPLWSCPSVELAMCSHSGLVLPQPKPGCQVYLGLGLVPSGELKDIFFFLFFFLQRQLVGFEPAIFGFTVKCFNHLATQSHT